MRSVFRLTLLFLGILRVSYAGGYVTNPARDDGFGGQFQTIIIAMMYAELEDKTFLYTPFRGMAHNYSGDPEFLQKKEQLINLIAYFPLNDNLELQNELSVNFLVGFFEQNVKPCVATNAYKTVKQLFRLNKNRAQYFDDQHFHVAVHIRRPNPHDCRVDGTNTPDSVYLNIINSLREKHSAKNPLFHVFSQGNLNQFKEVYQGEDIRFHIDESVEDTFTALVLADALVLSRSSLSYVAGLLSEGEVYYMRFWHAPLPWWINVGN